MEEAVAKKPRFKLDKASLKLIVVLGIIALVSSLLLSVVYKFTEATIDYEERTREKLSENYDSPISSEIDLSDYQSLQYTSVSGAYIAEDGAYMIISHSDKAYSAKGIDLIVIIKNDEIIKVIKSSANETPGIGATLVDGDYLSRFIGLNVNSFNTQEIGKATASVDYVTNATRTSTGINYAVTSAVACYKYISGGKIDG